VLNTGFLHEAGETAHATLTGSSQHCQESVVRIRTEEEQAMRPVFTTDILGPVFLLLGQHADLPYQLIRPFQRRVIGVALLLRLIKVQILKFD
jgi:hypothetical protein